MNVGFKEQFLNDLQEISSQYALRGIRLTIRQVESAASPKDIGELKSIAKNGNYYSIAIGNYRLGLKLDANAVIFVRALHYRDILRFFHT
ncbi:MAG: type II toxin-antitoxin system RelE/ParE family toxin [Calditrichaeota bacterium]|nr:type II toxin-antitoxin system RelE/ParE family toxin [Calditrichota bacterium]